MIRVDYDKCIKCKMCIKDCFPENITFEDEKIRIKGECMMCGHCVAVCPTNAITFEGYEETKDLKELNSKIEPETFLNFVKSRRSIRHFKDKKIDKDIIERLLEIGRYSPTGANIQDVKYYVIQDSLEEFKPLVWEGINNFVNSDEKNLFLKRYKNRFIEMGIMHNEELVKKFRLKRNTICACMLIGYPNINYQRTAPRKEINIEWL